MPWMEASKPMSAKAESDVEQCGEVGLARYERADAEQRYDGKRRNRHDFGEAE